MKQAGAAVWFRVVFGCLLVATICLSSEGKDCISKLPQFINGILNEPQYKHLDWGILVTSPSKSIRHGGDSLASIKTQMVKEYYAHNADTFYTPASNNKVITSSTLFILTNYTASFAYETPILIQQHQSPQQSPMLCLRGRGDPSMTVDTLAGIADRLVKQHGIKKLRSVVLDQSYLHGDGQPFPTSWEWEDLLADYGAQPQALIVNENALTVTVSPSSQGAPVKVSFNTPAESAVVQFVNQGITVASNQQSTLNVDYPIGSSVLRVTGTLPLNSAPMVFNMGVLNTTNHFLRLLQYSLRSKGIAVEETESGGEGLCDSASDWKELFSVRSAPLAQLMNWTLQISDNLYAEIFLRTIGAVYTPKGNTTGSTMQDGIALVQSTLRQAGVDVSTFKQADGSGLSRHTMVSPRALIEVLNAVFNLPGDAPALYRSFLPLAGETGSLRHRFIGTPAQGKVMAKTGTMTGVNALSGYVANPAFEDGFLLFSIIINGNALGSQAVYKGMDAIVVYLADALNC